MKKKVSESIWIKKDAYLYLNRIMRQQRGCKPMTEKAENRLWERASKLKNKYQVISGSFGGGDGTYYGKWWSWNLETITVMLAKAGFDYEKGESVETIVQ